MRLLLPLLLLTQPVWAVTPTSEKVTNKVFDVAKKAKDALRDNQANKPYLFYETRMEMFRYRLQEIVLGHRIIPTDRIVANPKDAYSLRDVGPSDKRLGYHRKVLDERGRFEGRPTVRVTKQGYMLVNGHHRWHIAREKGIQYLEAEVVHD